MSNTRIWDKVKSVDDKYTKDSNQGGRKQTSITTLYPVMKMTEVMGPIGELWRPNVVDQYLENTKPVEIGGVVMMDGDSVVWEQTHTLFMQILTRGSTADEFEVACQQFGHTKRRYVAGKTAGGRYLTVDEEAPKKSYSDALKKCLSLFGVCADVYMGDFEDNQYRAEAQDRIMIEKADKSADEEEAQKLAMKAEFDDGIKAIELCPTLEAAKKVYTTKIRYFNSRLGSAKFNKSAEYSIRKLTDAIEKKQETDK
jgi:hypothetical protein